MDFRPLLKPLQSLPAECSRPSGHAQKIRRPANGPKSASNAVETPANPATTQPSSPPHGQAVAAPAVSAPQGSAPVPSARSRSAESESPSTLAAAYPGPETAAAPSTSSGRSPPVPVTPSPASLPWRRSHQQHLYSGPQAPSLNLSRPTIGPNPSARRKCGRY